MILFQSDRSYFKDPSLPFTLITFLKRKRKTNFFFSEMWCDFHYNFFFTINFTNKLTIVTLQKYSVIGRSRASLIPLSLSFCLSDFFRAPVFFLGIFFNTPVLVNFIIQPVLEVPRRSYEKRKKQGTGRRQWATTTVCHVRFIILSTKNWFYQTSWRRLNYHRERISKAFTLVIQLL